MMTGDTGFPTRKQAQPVRKAIVAGQFYPAGADVCRDELERYLQAATVERQADLVGRQADLVGGLVPHAGWRCSGAVAARVFAALRQSRIAGSVRRSPSVIVLFGGVHRYRGKTAAMFSSGQWETPLGNLDIDSTLAELLAPLADRDARLPGRLAELSTPTKSDCRLITSDVRAHEDEHSLEVQMPFVRHVFPDAKVVPIMVPIDEQATKIGKAVGQVLSTYDEDAMIIGTTDLTHYGPRYGFSPQGVGAEANAWAKNDNDRRFVELMCSLKADELVSEASERRNACNSGAAAATVAACVSLGATRGVLLEHTTSAEVLSREVTGDQDDSVGYAGIVFEK